MTFGIYNNDQVVVTVNAKDEKISSGIKEISLYNGEDEITADDNDYTYEMVYLAKHSHLLAEKMNSISIC